MRSVPVVVDMVVDGVAEVTEEVVIGSRMLVRCISIGLVVIAAMAIVAAGYWVWYTLGAMLKRRLTAAKPTRDHFERRYGGRLRGGGKVGQGLDPKDVIRLNEWNIVGQSSQEDSVERVDPDKLALGDEVSFIYSRGSRPGQRRAGKLIAKKAEPNSEDGVRLMLLESDGKGGTFQRPYWPSLTSHPIYLTAGEKQSGPGEKRDPMYIDPAEMEGATSFLSAGASSGTQGDSCSTSLSLPASSSWNPLDAWRSRFSPSGICPPFGPKNETNAARRARAAAVRR